MVSGITSISMSTPSAGIYMPTISKARLTEIKDQAIKKHQAEVIKKVPAYYNGLAKKLDNVAIGYDKSMAVSYCYYSTFDVWV